MVVMDQAQNVCVSGVGHCEYFLLVSIFVVINLFSITVILVCDLFDVAFCCVIALNNKYM